MEEQKLKIIEVSKGDKVYKNLDLRELDVDKYIIIEKVYAEGMGVNGKYGKMFSIGVKYKDEVCSAFISDKQHEEYKVCGGVGDKVKITKYKAEVKVKAGELLVKRLKFERA